MAGFQRTNGDFLPVAVFDADTGNAYIHPDPSNISAITSARTVQPQGPLLDFFTITGNGSQVLDNINAVFQTVQQLATVYMYEYTTQTDATLAIAVYPVGAWTTTTLDNVLTNAWTSANVTVTTTATFTG